jgi:hypothetical protein
VISPWLSTRGRKYAVWISASVLLPRNCSDQIMKYAQFGCDDNNEAVGTLPISAIAVGFPAAIDWICW